MAVSDSYKLASDPDAIQGSAMPHEHFQLATTSDRTFEDEFPGNLFLPTETECKQRLLLTCYMLDQQRSLLFGRARSHVFSGDGINLPFPQSQASWDGGIVQQQSLNALVQWPVHDTEDQQHLIQHAHDIFQSMHMVGSFFDSRRDAALGFTFGVNDDPTVLPVMEHSPRIQLAYHTLALCENVPIRDVLAVAGETWIMSEKLTREEEYIAAQVRSREWATRLAGSGFELKDDVPQIQRAVAHTLKILEIQQIQPNTGLLFQEWSIYLASLVIWARAYALSDGSQGTLPSAERRPSSTASERAVASLIAGGSEHDISLSEAMNVLSWTRDKIESVDIPHNCGLTNGALDVLRKLIAKGTAPGWF